MTAHKLASSSRRVKALNNSNMAIKEHHISRLHTLRIYLLKVVILKILRVCRPIPKVGADPLECLVH